MNPPKLAIQNYQFVLILVLSAIGIGIYSFLTMLRAEDPIVEFPIYVVVAIYPGTSPTDMETLVVDPIETELKEIEKIDHIVTTILEGIVLMQIHAEFDNIDIDAKYEEVVAAVSRARDKLPNDLYSLDITKYKPSDAIIAQFALYGEEASYEQLEEQATQLQTNLELISGLREVRLVAIPKREIRIALDMEKMAARRIPLPQVMKILQDNNANIPAGNIKMGDKIFSIKTTGSFQNIAEIRKTIVQVGQGSIVYLDDIADVRLDYADEKYLGRFNGTKSIYLTVTQQKTANVLEVSKKMQTVFQRFKERLPPQMKGAVAFEQAPEVEKRLDDFFINLLQGIFLVGITIYLFLGFRSSIVVMTVIPTAILIAIATLAFSGYGLQQISIAGLVIALGLLVDNAIVVIENIHRYLAEGYSVKDAAIKGTSEVSTAITSSTLTTIMAFFPLTQLGGGVGIFIKSMPLIVIFGLIASLLLALTFAPLFASKILLKKSAKPTFMGRKLHNIVTQIYRPILKFSLQKPAPMIVLTTLLFLLSLGLFVLVGISFFPKADKPIILVNIDTPEGTNIYKTDEAARFVEKILNQYDYVVNYSVNVGNSNPQIYYNQLATIFAQNHAQILVNLQPWEAQAFNNFLDSLRQDFKAYVGAKITVSEFTNGPPFEAPIAIKAIGDNLDTLKKIGADLAKMIQQEEGTINVVNPLEISKMSLKVNVDREKAGLLGIPLANIDLAVRTGLTGVIITDVNLENGKNYDMVIRQDFKKQPTIEDFDKIFVTNALGASIHLRQVAHLEFQSTPSQIDHFSTRRTVTITADVEKPYNPVLVTQSLISQLDQYPLPEGYEFYIAGEYEVQQISFGDLGSVLVVAMMAIFTILVLQFRSLSQPFVIFLAIPFAFTGSIVALYFANYSFSFLAFVGFTTLVGIVINDSIILVDYTNQLLGQGKEKIEAIQSAAESRFAPIILTSLTTILGVLPLTLTNSDLWSPLGWTIIGGMISATIMILLLVPMLLNWLTRKD